MIKLNEQRIFPCYYIRFAARRPKLLLCYALETEDICVAVKKSYICVAANNEKL